MAHDTEEKRLDVHDLFVFLEKWRRQNERDSRAEIRWLCEPVRVLGETAFNIKRGDMPIAQQEAVRRFRCGELESEICKLEKQVGERHQELERLQGPSSMDAA